MAQDRYIAISPQKKVHNYTQVGLTALKDLHKRNNVTGWAYGKESEKDKLMSQIKSTNDLQAENKTLAAKVAALEAQKAENKTLIDKVATLEQQVMLQDELKSVVEKPKKQTT
jgi:Tfp pilus assembly protein PilO